MVVSIVTAACFAIGHHFFYKSLQGQSTDQGSLSQNENIYIGTALAFFVKACLAAAVSAAYAQVLWRTLLRQSLRVDHIDALSMLATTPTAFDDVRLFQFPLLVLLAVVAWCAAIVSIFPPGTLSVSLQIENISTNSSLVSSLDFTLPLVNSNKSRGYSNNQLVPSDQSINLTDVTTFQFEATPLQITSALASITALTGDIPRIPNTKANNSYSLDFFGPALQCTTMETTTDRVYCSNGTGHVDDTLYYLSFLTYPQDSGDSFGTFFNLSDRLPVGSDNNISCDSITSFRNALFGSEPPRLNVVTQTSIIYGEDASETKYGWNVTTCQITNATYAVDVRFSGNDQSINATLSGYTPLGLVPDYIPGFNASSGFNATDADFLGPSASKIYNYLSMIALMGQITLGTVSAWSNVITQVQIGPGATQNYKAASYPSIFNTRLNTSPELQAFWEQSPGSGDDQSATFTAIANSSSLARQMEQLFTNLTLALLTNPATSSNATVDLVHWRPVNLYSYNAMHLWLSYGIGLLITLVVVIFGYTAVSANGSPYSTKFSTFLRTMPSGQMESKHEAAVDLGADPIPADLARSKLRLGHDHGAIEMVQGSDQNLASSSSKALLRDG